MLPKTFVCVSFTTSCLQKGKSKQESEEKEDRENRRNETQRLQRRWCPFAVVKSVRVTFRCSEKEEKEKKKRVDEEGQMTKNRRSRRKRGTVRHSQRRSWEF